jgi:hypothetical protein
VPATQNKVEKDAEDCEDQGGLTANSVVDGVAVPKKVAVR